MFYCEDTTYILLLPTILLGIHTKHTYILFKSASNNFNSIIGIIKVEDWLAQDESCKFSYVQLNVLVFLELSFYVSGILVLKLCFTHLL